MQKDGAVFLFVGAWGRVKAWAVPSPASVHRQRCIPVCSPGAALQALSMKGLGTQLCDCNDVAQGGVQTFRQGSRGGGLLSWMLN